MCLFSVVVVVVFLFFCFIRVLFAIVANAVDMQRCQTRQYHWVCGRGDKKHKRKRKIKWNKIQFNKALVGKSMCCERLLQLVFGLGTMYDYVCFCVIVLHKNACLHGTWIRCDLSALFYTLLLQFIPIYWNLYQISKSLLFLFIPNWYSLYQILSVRGVRSWK